MADRYRAHGWTDDDAERMIDAGANGTELDLLRELRTRIIAKVADPTVAARDLAALTSRLVDVAKAIREAENAEPEGMDPIAAALELDDEPFDPSTV